MATTVDYLNKLILQKNALADNLVTKGVTASYDETLETLVPKVLNISGGSVNIANIRWNLYHDPDPYNFYSNIKNTTGYNGGGYNFSQSIPNQFGFYQSLSGYNITHSQIVDFTNVKKIIINGATKSNINKLTATAYYKITNESLTELSDDWTMINQSVGQDISEFSVEIDCSTITGEQYIYFAILHGTENGGYTSYLYIYNIEFVYSEDEPEYVEGIVKEYNDFNSLKWIEITQHEDNSFVMTNENTIECCFNYSTVNSSSNQGRILETKDSSGYLRYLLNIYNGFFEFSINKDKWYSPIESGNYYIDTYEMTPNTLYNITSIFKNTGTDIYINGILFVSISETIAADIMIKNLCLKAAFTTSNREMEGRIFSLRMYNRALSENEILQNWETDVKRYGIDGTKTYLYNN